ncbi:ABC transporter substrate-binding protein [Pusillimonas caeni]|uniref:ABC transporter substrate-binding protein n=1 Tax=Pusillimonas caeni TaxID=1348472 RepID=UPI000E59D72A|nr:ABC transporter substrate-binding protein [Pusillimonas caeni]TFL10006.1 ABC transporter substrate-binding protein [Pusillimonas caeni]
MNKKLTLAAAIAAGSMAVAAAPAHADINVGISLSSTGPAAALGIPEKNTVPLLPDTIEGEKVNYIVLDDATDATQAGRNARKLVAEDKVDILLGSSATPPSAAMAEVANESQTPQITIAPVELPEDKNKWVFRAPQHYDVMADGLISHMKATGVKTLGFIGYTDAYGESWLTAMKKATEAAGIKLTAVERFNRNDTSVTGQAVKIVAAKPDAVLVVASGTPSVLPQVTLQDRGFKGQIYQTHGTATKEFMRVGGKAVEGTIMPVGPVVVADQLPDSNPSKKLGLDYTERYEAKYGKGSLSAFGAQFYDAFLLFQNAVPVALKAAKPGTPEFRAALRDAIENSKEVVTTHGVYNMTPTDHFGMDERARVLITVKDGDWSLVDMDAVTNKKQ